MDLAEQATALDARARYHKKASQNHRDAARDCRIKQARLEAECKRLGIEIIYREGNPHGGPATRPPDLDRAPGNHD